ncbi:hypothetical protein GALMADRAFT_270981 [Galerina marginata CBS 339.88]|uniref:Uncharacterized protein n=1 Tax=Galerina marginata (strain CBS 339.88) TaxID=685588 RepID=A0A067SPF1_GALM3|nr:hypothetical protein GALMADRAFT_270981 [Galerina marginata CBS 339.88]
MSTCRSHQRHFTWIKQRKYAACALGRSCRRHLQMSCHKVHERPRRLFATVVTYSIVRICQLPLQVMTT